MVPFSGTPSEAERLRGESRNRHTRTKDHEIAIRYIYSRKMLYCQGDVLRRVKCNRMDNHCDIYNVTLIISQKSEERGLLNEQRSNTGVFQIHPHTLPEGIKGIEAVNLRRILFKHWLQQEICDS